MKVGTLVVCINGEWEINAQNKEHIPRCPKKDEILTIREIFYEGPNTGLRFFEILCGINFTGDRTRME
jgi:hypothetical protein